MKLFKKVGIVLSMRQSRNDVGEVPKQTLSHKCLLLQYYSMSMCSTPPQGLVFYAIAIKRARPRIDTAGPHYINGDPFPQFLLIIRSAEPVTWEYLPLGRALRQLLVPPFIEPPSLQMLWTISEKTGH